MPNAALPARRDCTGLLAFTAAAVAAVLVASAATVFMNSYKNGFTLSERFSPTGTLFGMISWLMVQPSPHVYPRALGGWHISLIFLAAIAGMTTFLTWSVAALRKGVPISQGGPPGQVTMQVIEDGFYNFFVLIGVSAIFYYFGKRQRAREAHTEGKDETSTDPNVKQKRPMLLPIITALTIVVVVAETTSTGIHAAVNADQASIGDDWDLFTLVLYVVGMIFVVVLTIKERKHKVTYSLAHLLAYMPSMAFGVVVSTRFLDLLVMLMGVDAKNLDAFLPVIFIIYKAFFSLVLPYLYILTRRMGRRDMSLEFIFAAQFAESLFLDGLSIISSDVSGLYVAFLMVRIGYGALLGGGAFRLLSDRIGITKPMEVLTGEQGATVAPAPANTDDLKVEDLEKSTKSSLPPPAVAATTEETLLSYTSDGAINQSSLSGSLDPPEGDGRKSEDADKKPPDLEQLRHDLMRKPYGDTPMAQLIFALQYYLAALLSPLCVLIMSAVDRTQFCSFACLVPMSAIEARGGYTLIAWLAGVIISGYLLKRRLNRCGISDSEMLHLSLQYMRQALPVLCTAPVYVLNNFLAVTSIISGIYSTK